MGGGVRLVFQAVVAGRAAMRRSVALLQRQRDQAVGEGGFGADGAVQVAAEGVPVVRPLRSRFRLVVAEGCGVTRASGSTPGPGATAVVLELPACHVPPATRLPIAARAPGPDAACTGRRRYACLAPELAPPVPGQPRRHELGTGRRRGRRLLEADRTARSGTAAAAPRSTSRTTAESVHRIYYAPQSPRPGFRRPSSTWRASIRRRRRPRTDRSAFSLHARARCGEFGLDVYDATGRRVRTVTGATALPPGSHQATWDGRDDDGRAVASGVYTSPDSWSGTGVRAARAAAPLITPGRGDSSTTPRPRARVRHRRRVLRTPRSRTAARTATIR